MTAMRSNAEWVPFFWSYFKSLANNGKRGGKFTPIEHCKRTRGGHMNVIEIHS